MDSADRHLQGIARFFGRHHARVDKYPRFSITGTLNYSAGTPQLAPVGALVSLVGRPQGLDANIGPTFQWNILNYGRILNNVRLQDARFQELVAAYQNAVLTAAQDVENGLVTFLRAQERAKLQGASVEDLEKAVKIVLAQYREGTIDLTRVTQLEQSLVLARDTLAQARGEIGLGLTQVYRALGGGWQIRLGGCEPTILPSQAESRPPAESLGAPSLSK